MQGIELGSLGHVRPAAHGLVDSYTAPSPGIGSLTTKPFPASCPWQYHRRADYLAGRHKTEDELPLPPVIPKHQLHQAADEVCVAGQVCEPLVLSVKLSSRFAL